MFKKFSKYLVRKSFRSSVESQNVVTIILTFWPELCDLLSFILRASINIKVFPVPALPYTNRQVSRLLSTGKIETFIYLYFSNLNRNIKPISEIISFWSLFIFARGFPVMTFKSWSKIIELKVPLLLRSIVSSLFRLQQKARIITVGPS